MDDGHVEELGLSHGQEIDLFHLVLLWLGLLFLHQVKFECLVNRDVVDLAVEKVDSFCFLELVQLLENLVCLFLHS